MADIHPLNDRWPELLPYEKQSLISPGPGKPGHSAVYPHITLDDGRTFTHLAQIFERGLRVAGPNAPYIGYRPAVSTNPLKFADHFIWSTWGEVAKRRLDVGGGIENLFSSGDAVKANGLETVGLWSANTPEWRIVDLALPLYGKVVVPLYENFGPDSIEYIINHSDLSVIFVQPQNVSTLLSLSPKLPTLKTIITLGEIPEAARKIADAWGKECGIKILTLNEVEAIGAKTSLPPPPVTADTIATICYTSGTTGNPKGAVLTQGALAAATYSNLSGWDLPPDATPVMLSYLPLAHIFGRTLELNVTATGGLIGYSTGSPLHLLEDLQVLKPNTLPAVPRVLNRIYQAIAANLHAPGLKGVLFRRGVAAKLERLKQTGDHTHPFWDKLVFNKVRAIIGGRVDLVGSGSAPLNPEVLDFLRVALVCNLIQGYGMTENCGTCTRPFPRDPTAAGTVGWPQPVNEIKLIDVPSMGYSVLDKPCPRGEICVRGANCFSEYYKNPEATKETIDEEGWVHTGDVGLIDEVGRFKIIDRVKNIMKLSQGEYVALERIENVYAACPVVQQIYVHGDSLQSYLIAIVIPDPVILGKIASEVWKKSVGEKDLRTLDEAVKDEKIVKAVLDMLTKDGVRYGLKGYEFAKRLYLTNELFSTENNCLTPTMKVRRKVVQERYKAELDALYALGEPTWSTTLSKL
ncbi:long-chain-fatty-acid-CoA ligase [Thelephora ganbajun]|uniref:Long-chain-fatty-acid-CoA ligase n=1 Tax=Thelephora ganbajun TaxID=370292 RepID=A0ACB6ZEN6_THEGA|nr:long-chain-fatty-acid-CoA ligase [Thelephora ganbajun]